MKKIIAIFIVFTLCLTACGRQPLTWQEQYDLGVRYLSEGNYQEAIIAFTAAIEIDPRNPAAYLGRADAHIASGETEENFSAAEADYKVVLELDSKSEEAYTKLADAYKAMGELDEAATILEQGALAIDSKQMQIEADSIKVSELTDEELISLAASRADADIAMIGGVRYGAIFEQDWNAGIQQANHSWLFPVIHEGISNLEDVREFLNERFTEDNPQIDLSYYVEIDGRLYTRNEGIGGDVALLDRQITSVQERKGNRVVFSGFELRIEMDSLQIIYTLALEGGKWKCANYERESL